MHLKGDVTAYLRKNTTTGSMASKNESALASENLGWLNHSIVLHLMSWFFFLHAKMSTNCKMQSAFKLKSVNTILNLNKVIHWIKLSLVM